MKTNPYLLILLLTVLMACRQQTTRETQRLAFQPALFPDYTDITIPYNIAPLNFQLEDSIATGFSVHIKGKGNHLFKTSTHTILFPIKEWNALLEAEKGNTLHIEVTAHYNHKDAIYNEFTWEVSTDPIDRFLSYRLIEPAYEVWNKIQIRERDLESFEERILGDNNITENVCMNCHIASGNNAQNTLMHIRGEKGGSIYTNEGKIRKIDTKTSETGTAVYGELSADGHYGIFTTAEIIPILHSLHGKRLEVYDKGSDLVLIDFKQNSVSNHSAVSGKEYQETFPCFSADNRTVYFCRAPHLPQPDSTMHMHYDLYSIPFNQQTGTLGDSTHLVFNAGQRGKSVSFPKCSPDGRFLLFCVSDYGTFPIWHPETDLWLLDLKNGEVGTLPKANGRYSDSYHSWNSNSRWFAFASKRSDGIYGRVYFCHVDEDGNATKAFVLPQKCPETYRTTLKSYNIPELYCQPEAYDAHILRNVYLKKETEKFKYKSGYPVEYSEKHSIKTPNYQ